MSIPDLTLTRPLCSICDESCDAPRLVKWDCLTNERIKLCSDVCLEAYNHMNFYHRMKLGKLIKNIRNAKIERISLNNSPT